MTDLHTIRILIIGMGGISRAMHAHLTTQPWYPLWRAGTPPADPRPTMGLHRLEERLPG